MRAILLAGLLAAAAAAPAQPQDRSAALAQAYGDVLAARAALERADAAREKGVEPLPGERLGLAGGRRSRLSDEYWARQERLDKDVLDARKRLDEALARWRDAR